MADFNWVPKELEGRFSYINNRLVASCEVCGATKSTSGKGSVIRDIASGKENKFRFCSIHGDFGHAKPSPEDVASWPEGHKRCRRCLVVRPFSEFHKHSAALFGYAVECKKCRKPVSKAYHASRTFEQTMFNASKSRATKNGIPHTITLEDIVIPEKCPILNVPIQLIRNSIWAPSLDQIQPGKGYTPDNIMVISRRANVLKNDMSKEEARLLADWMDSNCNWTIVRG